MKIFIGIFLAIFIPDTASCQVFKVTDIQRIPVTLSHWKVLDQPQKLVTDSFVLWEEKQYSQSSSLYEVKYFKADAKTTFEFLNGLIQFTEKYRNENNILTFMNGVKVKTVNGRIAEYIMVYDDKQKYRLNLTLKHLFKLLDSFTSYCNQYNIAFRED